MPFSHLNQRPWIHWPFLVNCLSPQPTWRPCLSQELHAEMSTKALALRNWLCVCVVKIDLLLQMEDLHIPKQYTGPFIIFEVIKQIMGSLLGVSCWNLYYLSSGLFLRCPQRCLQYTSPRETTTAALYPLLMLWGNTQNFTLSDRLKYHWNSTLIFATILSFIHKIASLRI